MTKQKIKVLFFANFPTKDKRSVGGATVLGKRIFDFVSKQPQLIVKHYQIRYFWRSKFQIIDYLIWLFRFPFVISGYDVVSFHATKDFHFSVGPFLWLWAKLFKKKIIYHLFGGVFNKRYEKKPLSVRFLLNKTILKSDYFVVETLALQSYFQQKGYHNILWLPNSREPVKNIKLDKNFAKKLVFFSRIVPEKGVNELIQTAALLPPSYQLDVYGPLDPNYYKQNPFKGTKVNYKGVIHPDQVISKLLNYDILLLPTYYSGEGYPGIIIEALSAGIPVITTDCCVMSEIITDGYNGFLVPVKNPDAIVEAVLRFNDDNYQTFRKNALQSFDKFNSDKVFNKIVKAYLE